jgi:hypothetical protein
MYLRLAADVGQARVADQGAVLPRGEVMMTRGDRLQECLWAPRVVAVEQ